MIAKLDVSHRFSGAVRVVTDKVYVGIGGSGREAARTAYQQEVAFLGSSCPRSLLTEIDLCDETGRGIEPSFVPENPGALMRLVLPGVNCHAVVREHEHDTSHPLWKVVDPREIEGIDDTSKLGGWANPQVARAVEEFLGAQVAEFMLRLAKQIEAMKRATFPGWERTGGPLHIHVYASPCGAVGSTALHLVDKLQPLLKPPFRIIVTWLLLADAGRVTDRDVARALQHAALTEVLLRTQGFDE